MIIYFFFYRKPGYLSEIHLTSILPLANQTNSEHKFESIARTGFIVGGVTCTLSQESKRRMVIEFESSVIALVKLSSCLKHTNKEEEFLLRYSFRAVIILLLFLVGKGDFIRQPQATLNSSASLFSLPCGSMGGTHHQTKVFMVFRTNYLMFRPLPDSFILYIK